MKLTKLIISKAELLSIPEKERALFIQLANFNNDINILQKLMFISGNSKDKADQNEIVSSSLSSQALFFMRIQSGKLYEGWKMLCENFFNNETISQSYNKEGSPKGKENLNLLKKYFGKKNLLKNIRNIYTFHYSKESSENMLRQLSNAPETEKYEMYFSEESGNCFYSIAHDLLNSAILDDINSEDWPKAMNDFFQEILDISKCFLEFSSDCIRVIAEKYLNLKIEEVDIPEPPSLNDIILPFFVRR